MILREVPLTVIDFEDETYRISEVLDLVRMRSSLQAVGLINPVVLLECAAPSAHKIVCGFRRLHGLRQLGRAEAAGRLLQPADFSPLEVFLKALWDNLSHRQLSPLEAARVLFKLKHQWGVEDEALVTHFLPLLGLSPHRNVLHSYLSLHRLHPDLRSLLNAGDLALSSAGRLAEATPEVQAGVAPVLAAVRLSANLQRKVLELAEDLAAISGGTLVEVLNEAEILEIAGDTCLSAFQKGEKIHACLYRRRNPRVSKARETFLAEKKKLSLPGTVRLSPDPFFESPRLRVEFDVASAEAFRETVEVLGRTCRAASLERLFQIW
jgi:ParB-like chromosome segregation protein Spo0J